jgi:hypothetical protein
MLASSRGITGSNMDGKNIKSRNTDKCQNRGFHMEPIRDAGKYAGTGKYAGRDDGSKNGIISFYNLLCY